MSPIQTFLLTCNVSVGDISPSQPVMEMQGESNTGSEAAAAHDSRG